jgi:hypothetical protein
VVGAGEFFTHSKLLYYWSLAKPVQRFRLTICRCGTLRPSTRASAKQ